MYLFSAVLLAGLIFSIGAFIYSLYEYAWDMFKIPLREKKMKLMFWTRIYLVIKNVFLQRKLFKDLSGGIMHAIMFWGFIAFGFYSLDVILTGIIPSYHYFITGLAANIMFFTVDIFAFVVLLAVVYSVIRRWVIKIPRYRGYNGFEAYFILILIAGLMITYFGLGVLRLDGVTKTIPGSIMGSLAPKVTPITYALYYVLPRVSISTGYYLYWTLWSLHVLTFLAFLVYIPRSKHLHLVAAPLNVLLADDKPMGQLTTIDFEKDTRFGATDIRDFSWKDYFDFYACTECGRCTANCPANLTGKTLSPRDIIWDLREVVMAEGKKLRKSGENPSESQIIKPVIGEPILEEDLWSCTTCGACIEQCPVMIDHVDKIVDMRRSLVLNQGKAPKEVLDLYNNLQSYSSPWAVDPSTRAKWSDGIDIVDLSKTPDAKYDILYWVGCVASYDPRNQEIAKSVTKVLKQAGVSFAILGSDEKCTGDPARRTGNEYLAQDFIKQNVETLKNHRVQKVLASCPHCFNSLKNDYREFGIELEVYHHTEFINNLIKEKKLNIKPLETDKEEKFTYHDSCYLGRYNNVYDQPRDVIGTFATNYEEMEMNKTKALCCGAGGGRLWMNETVGQKISHKRIEMADKVKATTLVTACPYCMTMLDDARKVTNKEERMDIKDLSELVAARIK